ncbi:hypothetical protein pb186bvf_015907 [Paramecium bursaria]
MIMRIYILLENFSSNLSLYFKYFSITKLKQMIILVLFQIISGQDICKQFLNYNKCVQTLTASCYWDYEKRVCLESRDNLIGCQPYLNQQACISQIGVDARCTYTYKFKGVFSNNRCSEIKDVNIELCSSQLSKYGCLSISNPSEICEWKDKKCIKIQDVNYVQQNFVDALFSVSACPNIQHYLIIHNIQLWQILDYEPVLQDQEIDEIEIQVEEKVYTNNQNIQNFYIENGLLKLYIYSKTKEISPSDVKLTDRYREGCIALEIQNDKDFQLIFNRNPINGINHIFCQQFYEHPNKIKTAFYDSKCNTIETQIMSGFQCKSVSHRLCGFLYNPQLPCQILTTQDSQYQYEYSCIDTKMHDEKQECSKQMATLNECRQAKNCYLEIQASTPYCTNQCLTITQKTLCLKPCIWADDQIDFQQQLKFNFCLPQFGCQHPGLSKDACITLYELCYWDDHTNICDFIDLKKFTNLKCFDANTLRTCTEIINSNEGCIWQNNTCINMFGTKFDSFPVGSYVNLNLCKRYKNKYYKYDLLSKQCNEEIQENYLLDATDKYSSKEFCLTYIYHLTQYLEYREWCRVLQPIVLEKMQCSELKNVGFMTCQHSLVDDGYVCAYDYKIFSCFQIKQEDLKCDTGGLTQQQCLSIQNQFCRWYDICQYMEVNTINSRKCQSLEKVTKNVCSYYYDNEPCQYDNVRQNCYTDWSPKQKCKDDMNAFACQLVLEDCFYDKVCQNVTDNFNFDIPCDHYHVSKSLCLKLSRACYWDKRCKQVDLILSHCEQFNTFSTPLACAALKAYQTKILEVFNYCQYNNGCYPNIEQINGCGSDLIINSHRCAAFTTGLCYFNNNQCRQIDLNQRTDQLILQDLSCWQSNLQLCTQIIKEPCILIDQEQNVTILNRKCSLFLLQQSCEELSTQRVSMLACANAKDLCLFQNGKCSIPDQTKYPCNFPGLSQQACIDLTTGACGFSQFCTDQLDSIKQCESLNIIACKLVNINCKIQNGQCQTNQDDFDIRSDSITYYSPQRCSIHGCYSLLGQCQNLPLQQYPCDLKGISQQFCQKNSIFCQFQNNICQSHQDIKCEQATNNKNQCIKIQTEGQFCVFKDKTCFNQNSSGYPCDIYEAANYNFCSQYQQCIYVDGICYNTNNKQSLKPNICYLFNTKKECLHQFQYSCQWDVTCKQQTQKIKLLADIYSQQSCILNNYKFQITSDGGLCYADNLTCEQLHTINCLKLQNKDLKCQLLNEICLTITQLVCDGLTKVNQFSCTQDCVYDEINNLCKPKNFQQTQCSQYKDMVSCLLASQTSCLFDQNKCIPFENQDISQISRYGCISLDGFYKYDEDNLKCIQISDQQFGCSYLSKLSCLQLTNNYQCYWNSNQCIELTHNEIQQQECKNLNFKACLKMEISTTICFWNTNYNLCQQDLTIQNLDCIMNITNYSMSLCTVSSLNCIYNFDNCQVANTKVSQCSGIGLSKSACLQSDALCKWDGYCKDANIYTDECNEFVTKQSCAEINRIKALYTQNIENQLIETKEEQQDDIPLEGDCTQQNNQWRCTKNKNYPCMWQKNKCNTVTDYDIDCENLSYLACVRSTKQKCAWRWDHCIDVSQIIKIRNINEWGREGRSDGDYERSEEGIPIHSAINANTCSTFQGDLAFYDDLCQYIDPEEVKCSTPGINKQNCLTSTLEKCMWVDKKCQAFVKTTETQCTDYQNVSIKVCQQIENEICMHNGSQCINYYPENVDILIMSRQACLLYSQIPVYWDGVCNELNFKIQCNQNILVNQLACIGIENERCIYDQSSNKCTSKYDLYSLRCLDQGVNRDACLKIETEPCQFLKNCQPFKSNENVCQIYSDVNWLVCARAKNHNCYYESISQSCKLSTFKQQCSQIGLNINACQENPSCGWNQDSFRCQCGKPPDSVCYGNEKFRCHPINCVFEYDECRPKRCEEITQKALCKGQQFGKNCLFNKVCQSYQRCEDIFDYDKCDTIQVDGQFCFQGKKQCITLTNYELYCPESDCTHYMCQPDIICRKKQCSDLNQQNCNTLPNCFVSELKCVELDNCQQSDCSTQQCNLQRYALLKNEQICTAQFCDFYGASLILCNGNESGGRACVLTYEYQCRACEQIYDECQCNEAKSICVYQDNQCKSILCNSFIDTQSCNQTQRCQWSQVLQYCTVPCEQTVIQDECNNRVGEFYYNQYINACIAGINEEPDLSMEFDFPMPQYSLMISILLLNLF